MINKIYSAGLMFTIVSILPRNHFSILPGNAHIQSHTFLIPANSEGTLRIIYNEECGIKPKTEDGSEILEFPNNGILILNTRPLWLKQVMKYFLIDNNGNKTKVSEILDSSEMVKRTPAILAGTLTVSGYTYHNDEVEKKGITYIDFMLYRKSNDAVENFASIQNIDSLSNAAVSACRAN